MKQFLLKDDTVFFTLVVIINLLAIFSVYEIERVQDALSRLSMIETKLGM